MDEVKLNDSVINNTFTMVNLKFILVVLSLLLFSVIFSFGQEQRFGFREPKNKIFVIAHRGAHNGIPENSLPAYQKAIDLGCDFVEIDVRTTKDSQFVSIHNSTIDNYVPGTTGKVSQMTLAELKSLDIGLRMGEEWKDTRIPTFEEILQLCRGKIGIYLDLKEASVPELMNIIQKYEMEQHVVWYIPAEYVVNVKDAEKQFGNSFPMPDPHSKRNIGKVVRKMRPTVIATDMETLSVRFIEKAHKSGAMVFADEKEGTPKEWQQMIRWGVDGIQTDHPDELILFLRNGALKPEVLP